MKFLGNEHDHDEWIHSEKGYIMVEPQLSITGRSLESIDEITLLTMVPKWLGPMKDWKNYLELAKTTGYNMLHFVPVQKRGKSDSPYSIADCLSLSNDLFDEDFLDERKKYQILKENLKTIETEYGMLSMTDVVWNHVASDSLWLHEHPEAAYNLKHCPYLKAAYELDKGLITFSENLEHYGLTSDIKSEEDLERVIRVFLETYLPELKLWEFWTIDVSGTIESLHNYVTVANSSSKTFETGCQFKLEHLTEKSLSNILSAEALYKTQDLGRFCNKVNLEKTLTILGQNYGVIETWHPDQIGQACESLKIALDYLNWFAYRQYDDDVAIIVQNIRNWVRYERLEARSRPSRIDKM